MSNKRVAQMSTPNRPTRHQQAAEAICSALYQMEFEVLGETEGGRVTWFHRGTKPKDIRVRVERSLLADEVKVVVEFKNLSNNTILKGEQYCTISAGPNDDPRSIPESVEKAVIFVLEIFKDVLSGEGVAGPISKLVDSRPEEE